MEEKYLLDTHCLIWFQDNNVNNISPLVLDILKNTANTIYFSQISLLEITIKQKIGKLPLFNATIEEIYTQAIADGFTFYPLQTNTFSITIISQYLNNTETHLIDYY